MDRLSNIIEGFFIKFFNPKPVPQYLSGKGKIK